MCVFSIYRLRKHPYIINRFFPALIKLDLSTSIFNTVQFLVPNVPLVRLLVSKIPKDYNDKIVPVVVLLDIIV